MERRAVPGVVTSRALPPPPPPEAPAHDAWLRALGRRLVGDEGDDLSQDVLLRLLRRGQETTPRQWLRRMLHDARRDLRRAQARRVRREQRAHEGEAELARSPEEELHELRLASALRASVEALPADLRTCLVLTYFEGLASAEVAARLRVPAGTVRRRNQLALARLRKDLERTFRTKRRSFRDVFALLPFFGRHDDDPRSLSRGWPRAFGSALSVATMAALVVSTGWQGKGPASDAATLVPSTTHGQPSQEVGLARPARHTSVAPEAAASTSCPSLASLVDEAPAGATILVPPCLYRESIRIDKPLALIAEPGAEVRGSDVWTEFERRAEGFRSERKVPLFSTLAEPCLPGMEESCREPAQVFVDGQPWPRVDGAPAAGEWALDDARHVWLGSAPAGHVVEVSVRQSWVTVDADDVTIAGFVFRHAASNKDTPGLAIRPRARRAVVYENALFHASGHAIGASGSFHRIERNLVALAGGSGINLDTAPFVTVADNVIEGAGGTFERRRGWFGGGIRSIIASGTIARNRISGSRGSGLFVVHGRGLRVENNDLHHNLAAGALVFRSRGVEVRGNRLWQNGWDAKPFEPGIAVINSRFVSVADNVLAAHPDGVFVGPTGARVVPDGFDPCRASRNVSISGNALVAPGADIRLTGDPLHQTPPPSCTAHVVEGNRIWSFDARVPAPLGVPQLPLGERERDRLLAELAFDVIPAPVR